MFQQEELWLITWTLAQAANTLHLQGKRLADVQPNSVMADYSGQLKVVCEASLPNVLTSVEKVRLKMLKSYVGKNIFKISAGGTAESQCQGWTQE